MFTDKISGKSRTHEQGLADLIDCIRHDDTVRIASRDRLGNATLDLYNLVSEITETGAAVQFVNERITVDKNGATRWHLMLGILAAFAELERWRIKEPQAEGIALARIKGEYVQAPKTSVADVEQAQAMLDLGLSKTEDSARLGGSCQMRCDALRRVTGSSGRGPVSLLWTERGFSSN